MAMITAAWYGTNNGTSRVSPGWRWWW